MTISTPVGGTLFLLRVSNNPFFLVSESSYFLAFGTA